VVFAVLVGVPLLLDLFVAPVRDLLDRQAKHHEVGVNLLEHVGVAALVAAAAYYWVLGFRRQQALRRYRDDARAAPGELVDWSRGELPDTRRTASDNLADGIARSPKPAVAVVQGRTGTARTSFVVQLVHDLARRNLIPIPVRARRDGSFALLDLAHEVFSQHVYDVLSSDQQADAIWHRATRTRDIVILVDGIDDEVVAMLRRDNGSSFRKAIGHASKHQIAVVLITTDELPMENITHMREDLNFFTRDEAESYMRKALKGGASLDDAVAALGRLHDPVDETLVAPFYLDLIVRLTTAGVPLGELPEQTDRWRAAVFGTYLESIERGEINPSENYEGADAADLRRRGISAKKAAEALASKLTIERALTVPRNRLAVETVEDRVLDDAQDLNLLWHGDQGVGFVGDDLGAYLAAVTNDDPSRLLEGVRLVAERADLSKRVDRHMLLALIFWHLLHEGPKRVETFNGFLTKLKECQWTRPAVVATAARIEGSCGFTDFSDSVGEAVRSCIDSLDTQGGRNAQPGHTGESLRLVRALAESQAPEAHRMLWQLATNRNIEVEWPAAKALAMARGGPERTLQPEIEEALRGAESHATPASLSDPDNDLGYKIASLAWILPALRDPNGPTTGQLSRVADLCLAEGMSPLRGEMSLAQGIKLAVMNGRMASRNVEDAREYLLFRRDGGVRYWHARLVLVQAMLAYAWTNPDDAGRLKKDLDALRSSEPHPLVRRGIELSREGLRELRRSPNENSPPLTRYMWTHEREVVKWVEQGKPDVTQLAADVVLLSNMTYRRRKQEASEADRAATLPSLPPCIRSSSDRRHITSGCTCPHGLCSDPEPAAVLATRARFSESFCRQQARLVTQHGPPRWTKRSLRGHRDAELLKQFWDEQANIVQRN
jgi:hypothetical protein